MDPNENPNEDPNEDPNERDHAPATTGGPSVKEHALALGSTDVIAPSGGRKAEMLAKAARLPEAPVSSNLRKAHVRAALFRKLEPIRIGRFILLEPIGAGAMGEIYAAYDEQLDRKVALKLVRGGSELTVKADERLLREAQTLAQVSHPNVVQIYEAGAYNGRLFIAMELIRGKALSSWLRDAAQLPRAVRQREILRQFIAAGRGLEAAHAAGLAHRDFKPDNVLIGDDGRVRVVDFGMARALGDEVDPGVPAGSGRDLGGDDVPPSATKTATDDPSSSAPKLKAALRLTETGTVMGTPRFMAPEQMRGALADQRSDQFSFCVALYHALYDAFPFSGQSLRELKDSMEANAVAFAPGVPVAPFVRKALHRGLSVQPSQRFPSMAELLAALEPRRRHLRTWIAAAAGLIVVVASAVVMLRSQAAADPCAAAGTALDAPWSVERQVAMQAAFLRSDLPFAEPAWGGVKTLIDGYASRWRHGAIAACQATHVAHTQSAQQLDKRMLCLDRGRRRLAALISALDTGAPDAVKNAVEATKALPDLGPCSDPKNLLFGLEPPPALVAGQVATIRDQLARARTLELLGRYEDSLANAREASQTAEGLGYPPVHAEALAQIARALDGRGTAEARAEAERRYFEALDIAEAERHDQLAVEIWNKLVMLAVRMDSGLAQAHAWWRRNAAAVRRIGDTPYEQAKLHHMLGEIYHRESEYAKAADEEQRAIGAIERAPEHQLEASRYYDARAKSLERLGQLDEAMRLHERALAMATAALGPGHPNVVALQINYGWALLKRRQLDRARSVLEDALGSMTARYRDGHPDAAKIHSLLSDVAYRSGQLDRAAEHASASLTIYRRTLPSEHVRLAESYTNLANVEFMRTRLTSALAMYENALALRRRHLGGDHYQTGVTEGSIAETLIELERHGEAMLHLVEAERIFERGSGRERGTQAWILTVRGELLAGQGQLGAAIPVLERALAVFGDDTTDATHGVAMWTLARALHELGREGDRVRTLAARARAIFAAQGTAFAAHKREAVARFIDRLPAPAAGRAAERPPARDRPKR